MDITWIGMSRTHFEPGDAGRIRALVIHATADTNSRGWLRQGGSLTDPKGWISCHYLIAKDGTIWQLVRDQDIAWHAGRSRWTIDGSPRENLNAVSVGIELENLNDGRDPYPEAQLASAVALSRHLVASYRIPLHQLVRHRDISPGRKTDPAGLDWASFVDRVFAAQHTPLPHAYTEMSAPVGPTRARLDQAIAYVLRRPTGSYTRYDIAGVILPAYWAQCAALDIPAELALAQCVHETANFASFWAARPRRNPAGIGVTGEPGKGLYFRDWVKESIPAQLGRLLAYALPEDALLSPERAQALAYALKMRALPASARGSAQTLKALGKVHNPSGHGWASPGDRYGAAIARIATEICRYAA